MKALYYFLVDADPRAASIDIGRGAYAAFAAYAAAHFDQNNWTNVNGVTLANGRHVAGHGLWPADGWGTDAHGRPKPTAWRATDDHDPHNRVRWEELLRDAAAAVLYDLVGEDRTAAEGAEGSYAALCRQIAAEGPARLAAADAALRARGIETGAYGAGGLLARADVDALCGAVVEQHRMSAAEYDRHLLADQVARYAAVPALAPFAPPGPPEQYRAFDLRRDPAPDVSAAGILVCCVHT